MNQSRKFFSMVSVSEHPFYEDENQELGTELKCAIMSWDDPESNAGGDSPPMKVYLDMCCYNRPYDPQNQLSISMETQAKLFIQDLIKNEKIELVSSYMLDYEASNIPMMERKQTVRHFLDEHVSEYVGEENRPVVEKKADEIMATGIKIKDAAHVASAILTHCDYFISTDKRLLRYATDEIRMVNPIDFVREWEGEK